MTNETTNIEQKVRKHLAEFKQELNNHLTDNDKKRFLFELALQKPEREKKARSILT